MAREEWVALAKRRHTIGNFVNVVSGELARMTNAMVPEVVEGEAGNGMEEYVVGGGDF